MSSLSPTGPSTALPQAAAGDRVGEYTLIEPIGTGASAEVWRAREDNGGEVALKIHVFDAQEDWRIQARFREESATLARLSHPHILGVFGAGEDETRAWIVMELASRGNVLQLLTTRGPMHPAVAASLMIDVLSAVQHAHDHGIIHRDIKPQNLLLTESGRICLCDFGVARTEDLRRQSFTEPSTSLGSMSYMPPEQRLDARAVTTAADLYACGATLFAMLTNRSPVDLHLTPPTHKRWDRVAPVLRPILHRAIRYVPAERHPSARAMATALEAVLPVLHSDAPATDATEAEPAATTPRRRPAHTDETTEHLVR